MNILVVCVAGMSSSALVLKMRHYVEEHQLGIKVGTCSSIEINEYIVRSDVVMLAPQLLYMRDDIVRDHPDKRILIIRPEDYGSQNIPAILGMLDSTDNPNYNQRLHHFSGYFFKAATLIGTNRVLRAISDGMISLIPIILIGSVFVLLSNFPVTGVSEWLTAKGLMVFINYGVDATINCISLYTCFVVAYHLAVRLKNSGVGIGLNALICFFMLTWQDNNYLDATYFDASGLFFALFVAIVSTYIFVFLKSLIKRSPVRYISDNIAESFLAILPIIANCLLFLLIGFFFSRTSYGNLPSFIENVIQDYLAKLVGNNIISALLLNTLANFLWFFGIHGGSIVNSVTDGIYIPLAYENIQAYLQGQTIPYMINSQFRFCYIFGGAGSTLSLTILMTFFARSRQLRQLGKLTLPTGIFFINEGLIFGLPIFLNPFFIIPFILITPISGLLTYYVMKIGLIPYAIGFQIPWTTPPLISGFIQGGLRLALWQLFMIILQMLLWYPFFKVYDRSMVKREEKQKPI